jgi:hypothetical protein
LVPGLPFRLACSLGGKPQAGLGSLPPEIVVAVLDLCGIDWVAADNAQDLERSACIAEEAAFFVLNYAAGLRSFEVPKIVLGSLRHQFEDARDGVPAHLGLPLIGVFKARPTS